MSHIFCCGPRGMMPCACILSEVLFKSFTTIFVCRSCKECGVPGTFSGSSLPGQMVWLKLPSSPSAGDQTPWLMWCVTRHTSIVPSPGPVNRRRVWETRDTTLTERWLTGSSSAPPRVCAAAETLWQEFRTLREGNLSSHTLVDKDPQQPCSAH